MHGLGKGDGFLHQGGIVHVRQSFGIDFKTGVFTATFGGAEYGVDQLQGVVADFSAQGVGFFQADGNLGHHVLDALNLHRALLQNPPDFGHQVLQQVFISQMLEQVVIQVLHGMAELIGPQPVALLQVITDHQVQVHRHHLGEEIMGMFRRDRSVDVVAFGDRQQANLTQAFDQCCGGLPVADRTRSQGRHQCLGVVPIAATKEPGGFNGRNAFVDCVQPFGAEHQGPCRINYFEYGRNALDRVDCSKAANGIVKCIYKFRWRAAVLVFGFFFLSGHTTILEPTSDCVNLDCRKHPCPPVG